MASNVNFYVALHPTLSTYVTHLTCDLSRHAVLTLAEYQEAWGYSAQGPFEYLQVQESYDRFQHLLKKEEDLAQKVWDIAFLKKCLSKLSNLRHVSCSHREAWPVEFYVGCSAPMVLAPFMLERVGRPYNISHPEDLFRVTQALKEARVPVQFFPFQSSPRPILDQEIWFNLRPPELARSARAFFSNAKDSSENISNKPVSKNFCLLTVLLCGELPCGIILAGHIRDRQSNKQLKRQQSWRIT